MTTTTPPSPPSSAKDRLHVVLDLDSTLICTLDTEKPTEHAILQAVMQVMNDEDRHDINIHTNEFTPAFFTLERPGLHQFLQSLNEFADVSVFTARPEVSATLAVNFIDPGRSIIQDVHTQETMTEFLMQSGGVIHVKDLNSAFPVEEEEEEEEGGGTGGTGGWNPKRTIVIDDAWHYFGCKQPSNFLPIRPWGFDAYLCGANGEESIPPPPAIRRFVHDQYLLHDVLPFLKEVNLLDDVRPVVVNIQSCGHYERMQRAFVQRIESHLLALEELKEYLNPPPQYMADLRHALSHFRSYQQYCCHGSWDERSLVRQPEPTIEQKIQFVQEIL